MKMSVWITLGILVTALAFWIVVGDATFLFKPLFVPVIVLVFVVPPFGSFWMLYVVIRHEKRPLPYMLLAFVPYVFLGYYFDRVRGKKLESHTYSDPGSGIER